MSLRIIAAALTILVNLAGCIISTDNPVPTALRHPYFGQEVEVKSKDGISNYQWTPNGGFYKKADCKLYIAKAADALRIPSPVPTEYGTTFLVAESCAAKGSQDPEAYSISFITFLAGDLIRYSNQATALHGSPVRIVPDKVISYVARYNCLADTRPIDCIKSHFDPKHQNFLGVKFQNLTSRMILTPDVPKADLQKSESTFELYTNSSGLKKFADFASKQLDCTALADSAAAAFCVETSPITIKKIR